MDLNELAYHVARLYYLDGLTQQQIANKLGISRPKVSRLLSHARDSGMVEIKLKPPFFKKASVLSESLQEKLNLKEVIVAEVNDGSDDSIIPEIAKIGSSYISSILKDRQIVGWGWGRTIYWTVNFLHSSKSLPSSLFIPLIGGAGQSVKYYQVNSLVEKASEVFRSQFMYLNAPAFFTDKSTFESFLKEKQVLSVLEIWKKVDVAIFGLGKPVYDSEILKSEIDPQIIIELIKKKAVGDILARFFNKDGNICESSLNNLILGIDMEDLKRIPLRICLCGGKKKVEGIIAASIKKYFNVLITDSMTAASILEKLREEGIR